MTIGMMTPSHDVDALRTSACRLAEQTAGYYNSYCPSDGIPPWDFNQGALLLVDGEPHSAFAKELGVDESRA